MTFLGKKITFLQYFPLCACVCAKKVVPLPANYNQDMKKQTIISLFVLVFVCLLSSCVTQKQMTYLLDADSSTADSINPTFARQVEPVVKAGDALSITVSALDAEAVTPYNQPTAIYATVGESQLATTPNLQYYTVDEKGDIEMPMLGSFHVEGLKRSEVAALVCERLKTQVMSPTVNVMLINPSVTVMGEVNKPGRYVMPNGRVTLLEALGMAGDLTIYGKRDNVLVSREMNGKMEFARINLGSADLFTSPYYYLQQNDVVYVSPNKVRAISSANASLWLSVVSTVASATTVIVTVVNAAKPANSKSGESGN